MSLPSSTTYQDIDPTAVFDDLGAAAKSRHQAAKQDSPSATLRASPPKARSSGNPPAETPSVWELPEEMLSAEIFQTESSRELPTLTLARAVAPANASTHANKKFVKVAPPDPVPLSSKAPPLARVKPSPPISGASKARLLRPPPAQPPVHAAVTPAATLPPQPLSRQPTRQAAQKGAASQQHPPEKLPAPSSFHALEWLALLSFIVGATILGFGVMGPVYRNNAAHTTENKTTTTEQPPSTLSNLSASILPIPIVNAVAQPSRAIESTNMLFPDRWQKFVQQLEERKYRIELTQLLYPRLLSITLEKGTEMSLLLSEDEKHIEEISFRIHILNNDQPILFYRQLMTDMQDMLANGALRDSPDYFQQINLPLNLFEVQLPYTSKLEAGGIKLEVQILDPIYINLRFMPLRPKNPIQTTKLTAMP